MDLETGITVLLAELQELRHDIAALNDEVTGLHNSVARFAETVADSAAEPKTEMELLLRTMVESQIGFRQKLEHTHILLGQEFGSLHHRMDKLEKLVLRKPVMWHY